MLSLVLPSSHSWTVLYIPPQTTLLPQTSLLRCTCSPLDNSTEQELTFVFKKKKNYDEDDDNVQYIMLHATHESLNTASKANVELYAD